MEKEFVDYPEALALKELGFDEVCFTYFLNGIIQPSLNLKDYTYFSEMSEINKNMLNYENVLAPTFSQAFRWLREKYGTSAYISPLEDGRAFYHMVHTNINVPYSNRICTLPEKWETYEEAELTCLKKLIEIVKQK